MRPLLIYVNTRGKLDELEHEKGAYYCRKEVDDEMEENAQALHEAEMKYCKLWDEAETIRKERDALAKDLGEARQKWQYDNVMNIGKQMDIDELRAWKKAAIAEMEKRAIYYSELRDALTLERDLAIARENEAIADMDKNAALYEDLRAERTKEAAQ